MLWVWILFTLLIIIVLLLIEFVWLWEDFCRGGGRAQAIAERLDDLLPGTVVSSGPRPGLPKGETQAADAEPMVPQSRFDDEIAERDNLIRGLQGKVAVLEGKLDETRRRLGEADRDDLRKIKGIGPVIERLLHDQGISSYRQIAQMKDQELDALAAKLNMPAERVRRFEWIKTARELHAGKYGEMLG